MALGLVGRGVRAVSDHLNLYYRVLKGIDRDSVALRLDTGGSFTVRHSVTGDPVVAVTDGGMSLVGGLVLPAGSVTGAMIADGTIQNADIADNTITSAKLASGIAVPAHSIGTNELAPGAVHQRWFLTGIPATDANQGTAGSFFDLPGSGLPIAGLTPGSTLLIAWGMRARHTAVNGRVAFRAVWAQFGITLGNEGPWLPGPANVDQAHVMVQPVGTPAATSMTVQLQAKMVDAGAGMTVPASTGWLSIVEIRP